MANGVVWQSPDEAVPAGSSESVYLDLPYVPVSDVYETLGLSYAAATEITIFLTTASVTASAAALSILQVYKDLATPSITVAALTPTVRTTIYLEPAEVTVAAVAVSPRYSIFLPSVVITVTAEEVDVHGPVSVALPAASVTVAALIPLVTSTVELATPSITVSALAPTLVSTIYLDVAAVTVTAEEVEVRGPVSFSLPLTIITLTFPAPAVYGPVYLSMAAAVGTVSTYAVAVPIPVEPEYSSVLDASNEVVPVNWDVRVRKFWYDYTDEIVRHETICYVPFTEFMYSLELNGAGGGQVSFDLDSEFLQDGDLYEQLTDNQNLWEFLFNGTVVAQFVSTKYALAYVDATLSRTATVSGPGMLEAFARVGVFPPGHTADGTDYAFPMRFSGAEITANSFWAATDIPHLAFWRRVYEGSIPRQYSSSSPINHVGISFTETNDSAGVSWIDKVDFEPGQGQPNGGSLVDLLQANTTTVSADYYVRPSQTPPGQLLSDPDFAEGDAIGDDESGWTFEAEGGSNTEGFSTTEQRTGDRCAQIALGSPGTLPYLATVTPIEVDAQSGVSASVWIKATVAGKVWVRVRTYNSEGLDLYYPPQVQTSASEDVATTYARKKAWFFVPTGHDRMTVQIMVTAEEAAVFSIDDTALYGDFATLDVKQTYGEDLSDKICFFDSNVFSKQREIDMLDCENIVAASLIDDEHDALKLHVSRDFPAIQDYGRKEKWLDETSTTVAQATMVETRVEQYKSPISSWTVGAPPYSLVEVPADLDINEGYVSRATLTNRAGIDYTAGDYIGISSEKGRGYPKTSMPLRVQALSGKVDSEGTYTTELTMESLSQLLRRLPPGETRSFTSFSGQYWSTSGILAQAYVCKAGGESVMHGALAVLPPLAEGWVPEFDSGGE